MERKIGEIFNYQDNWYQCIENTGYGCIICHFNTHNNICCNNVLNIIGNCLPPYRKDYKSVVFRKLEKVGNPIMVENKSYQKIKVPDSLCNNCAFYDNFSRDCKLNGHINHYPTYSCLINEMFVEIKQNKGNYPIIALLEDKGSEAIFYYNKDGKCNVGTELDLMMLPEKKEGWIIIHKEAIYDKETAEKIARETTANVIRIQKIEWEE